MVPVSKNAGERSTAKSYYQVSLLSVVSKVFQKLENTRIVDRLEKGGLFSDFQYGFWSSQSTVDLLTVVSDRFARVFNRSGATQALYISKAFDSLACWSSLQTFFFYPGFLSQTLAIHRTAVEGRWPSFIPPATTSTCSQTFSHLVATLHVRWLLRIFSCNVCVYQTTTWWDLPPCRVAIWLIDDAMFLCLFDDLILGFCYTNLTW